MMLVIFEKIMLKLYLSVTVAIIIGVAFAYAMIAGASFAARSAEESGINLSVDKTTLNYGDNLTWNATKLPPNAEYTITVRWSGTTIVIGKGNANVDGEASGTFLIGENLPSGIVTLMIELVSNPTSNPTTMAHATLNILP